MDGVCFAILYMIMYAYAHHIHALLCWLCGCVVVEESVVSELMEGTCCPSIGNTAPKVPPRKFSCTATPAVDPWANKLKSREVLPVQLLLVQENSYHWHGRVSRFPSIHLSAYPDIGISMFQIPPNSP